jgi:hypothetical protein
MCIIFVYDLFYFCLLGVPSASDSNILKYPHQNHHKAAHFYHIVDLFLQSFHPNVQLINFLALTKEGNNRSHDGYHSFTDINILKAVIVLNHMKLVVDV